MTDLTPDKTDIRDLFGATAHDNTGDKLGAIKEVFLDDRTGQPTFVEVNHGLFGLRSSLVPLRGSSLTGRSLNLAFTKDSIKDAPDIDADNGLSIEEEEAVCAHYGLAGTPNADYFLVDDSPRDQVTTDIPESPIREDAENPPQTGLGAGAPAGAHRSDADTTITAEPPVTGGIPVDTAPVETDGEGAHARRDTAKDKTPGGSEHSFQRFPLRRLSDRQTGTVK